MWNLNLHQVQVCELFFFPWPGKLMRRSPQGNGKSAPASIPGAQNTPIAPAPMSYLTAHSVIPDPLSPPLLLIPHPWSGPQRGGGQAPPPGVVGGVTLGPPPLPQAMRVPCSSVLRGWSTASPVGLSSLVPVECQIRERLTSGATLWPSRTPWLAVFHRFEGVPN